MASYERRKKELQKAIPLLEANLPTELTFLDKGVEEYLKVRDEVFTDLYLIAGDLSDNMRAGDWRDKLAKGREALQKYVAEALRSVSAPGKETLDFQNSTVNAENMFWKTFENVNVGAYRDLLTLRKKNQREYYKDLQTKWETTVYENQPLREDSLKAMKELLEHVDKSIEQTASLIEKLENSAGKLYENTKQLDEKFKDTFGSKGGDAVMAAAKSAALTGLGFLGEKLNETVELAGRTVAYVASAWTAQYDARLPRYRQDVITQARVLTAVPQARRVTAEFLQKSGVDVARVELLEVSSALERWSTDLPSDGLKEDARDMVKTLVPILHSHVMEMDKAFEEFKKKHEGRYVGGLSENVERELVDYRSAEDFVSAMASKGIEAKFREWHADARRALERDFEEIFRRMEERLRDQPEELQKEIKSYIAAFKDQLNRNVKEWIEKIDKTIQEAEKTYAIDKVRKNYEPKEPLDALRGK